MRMWRNIKSLQVKIALLVGAIMVVVVGILVIYAAISLRSTATSTAEGRSMVVWGMIGVGAVLTAAALVMIWWAAAQIVRPIRQITATAQAMSGGDYSVQARVETKDEIGALTEAFNAMARQLADSIASLGQRIAERTHNLMAAAEVSHTTTELYDIETLLPRVVEMVREQFDLYYVGLFLIDEEGKFARLRAGTGEAGRRMIEQGWQLEVGGTSMIGRCASTGQADIQLDVGEAATHFDNPLLPDTRSEMALPLRSRGRVIGAMSIQSDRPAAFDQADISTLQNMADQIAAAIYNDRLFAEARTAIESLQSMQQRYQVHAWTEYAQTADVVSYETAEEGVASLGDAVLPEVRQAVTRQRPVVLSREQTQNQHSALVAPISFRGSVIGALGVHDRDGSRQWTEQDIALVQAVTERMGQAAESLRLLDDTQRREARERLTRQITDEIRGALTVDEAIRRAIKQLGDALDAEMVARMGSDLGAAPGVAKERG